MNGKNNNIYRSKVSKWIAGFYFVILLYLLIMLIGIPLFTSMTAFEKSVFIGMFLIITIMISFIIFRAYRLNFIISKDSVVIDGLFKKHKIMISDIKEVKKIPIPFGFRLFGASFLGGRYYIPGIGKASIAMSNFDDGVLIITKRKNNFIITPKNPLKFLDYLKREIN
jgi:hypothetical protein